MRAGLQRVENADGLVEWAVGEPGPAVCGRVRAYTGYREDMLGPVHRLETPTAEFNVIVSFGNRFRTQAVPGAAELSTFTSFATGLHVGPSRTAHDGRQLGVQIRLDPLGAFALFGVPLHQLGDRVVELAELLGPDADRWAERLSATPTWVDRFALLDRLLADRMAVGPVPSPGLARAWRTMQGAGGVVRVADLAAGAGCSHRHLVAGFREQVGVTPKTAARMLRYARAARLLARGDLSLAQVALSCGYADQSHLTREYAAFAGTTPGAAVAGGVETMGGTVRSS